MFWRIPLLRTSGCRTCKWIVSDQSKVVIWTEFSFGVKHSLSWANQQAEIQIKIQFLGVLYSQLIGNARIFCHGILYTTATSMVCGCWRCSYVGLTSLKFSTAPPDLGMAIKGGHLGWSLFLTITYMPHWYGSLGFTCIGGSFAIWAVEFTSVCVGGHSATSSRWGTVTGVAGKKEFEGKGI